MSNFLTEETLTTGSSTSWPFPAEAHDQAWAIVACGALGSAIKDIVLRRAWPVEVRVLPALLHNRPHLITARVEGLLDSLQRRGLRVALAYADCGTYGALDELCARRGISRLRGLHCYDVIAGPARVERLFAQEPGTYLLTDFLLRSFRRSVLVELGLDRHPELWNDYFAHYRRLVWLAERRSDALEREAHRIADMFNLPLEILDVGVGGLEGELEELLVRALGNDVSFARGDRA